MNPTRTASLLGLCLAAALLALAAATSPSLAAASPDACADLTAAITFDPVSPQVGQPVNINVRITNQGAAAAGRFRTYLYIDPSASPPTLTTPDTSWNSIFGLSAGSSYVWSYTGYVFTTAGRHVIYAWVDRDNDVPGECDETNNLIQLEVVVGGGGGCQPDAFESGAGDDTCGAARSTSTDGSSQRHNLCPVGDEDWMSFNGQAGVEYVINAGGNLGADADLTLDVAKDCAAPPFQGEDPVFGRGARAQVSIEKDGTYRVQVKHHDATYGPDTGYDFSIKAICSTDAYEPNNRCAQAGEITVGGASQQRSFCGVADEDWGYLNATGGVSYHFATQDRQSRAAPVLALYAGCEDKLLATSAPGGALDWTATSTGAIYLKIRNSDPSVEGLNTGYRLHVTAASPSVDGYEPDNTPDQAKLILTDGQSQRHAFSIPGDQDWLYFSATSGQTYRLETFDLAPATDTYLCLYEGDGASLIGCDDDSGAGLGSKLWWRAPATGRFYIRVRHFNPEVGGAAATYLVVVAGNTPLCDPDQWEPDDNLGGAKELTSGADQNHTFCSGSDQDWVRFWVNAPGAYALEANSLGADADPVLELYDVDGRTALHKNDDHGPGTGARVLWYFDQAGWYYARTHAFATTAAGRGTEYTLNLRPSSVRPTPRPTQSPTPTPTVTSSPTPTPTHTPTPLPEDPPWEVRTLIVTNKTRLTAYHEGTAVETVMRKLNELASHPDVAGLVVDTAKRYAVSAASARWDAAPTNIAEANAVVSAIRSLIWEQIAIHPTIEYIVLVGDDRIIPFRREADGLDKDDVYEKRYEDVSPDTPIGAALKQDHSLTDDFYATRSPESDPAYVPDLAIGRLVETPQEIGQAIDAFLSDNELKLNGSLVVGAGAQIGGANQVCTALRNARLPEIDCTLISNEWTGDQFRARHLLANPAPDLHFLNIGGRHWRELMAKGTYTYAENISASSADLNRSLIVAGISHGGLNLAPPNPHPLDLPQTYAQKGALYVANTGYSLLLSKGVGLSEQLMIDFARQLGTGDSRTIGKAWMQAKKNYRLDSAGYATHSKVLHEATFYGLPMYTLPQSFGPNDEEFPSVALDASDPALSGSTVETRTLSLRLPGSFAALEYNSGADGEYYALDGHVAWAPDAPAQPEYYLGLDDTRLREMSGARAIVWLGGTYTDVVNFDPTIPRIARLEDDAFSTRVSPSEPASGWDRSAPVWLNPEGSRVAARWGQFDAAEGRQRIYSRLDFDLTFSDDADMTAPEVHHIAARPAAAGGLVKVDVSDPSGIWSVIVVYTDNRGRWEHTTLTYDSEMDKWVGTISGVGTISWIAQVIDRAGNKIEANNKGQFYEMSTLFRVYLPLLMQ